MSTLIKILFFLLLICFVFYGGAMGALYLKQESLLFYPFPLSQDYEYSFNTAFDEINLTAEDGAVLNALHFKQDNPKGVLLYYHGNAGSLHIWGEVGEYFAPLGWDVVIMDFRTYGKSTGELSQENLYKDAELFYNYTLDHYPEDKIVVYGRSLGTGIATNIAAKRNPQKMILETPYWSILSMAKVHYPWLVYDFLVKYPMHSHKFIQEVNCPIHILHGTADKVVPYEQGKKLYESIKKKKAEFITFDDGGHSNLRFFDLYKKSMVKILH